MIQVLKELLVTVIPSLCLLGILATEQDPDKSVPFDRLEESKCSGHRQRMTSVIRNERQLRNLMRRINSDKVISPNLNFRTKMLIAVFQGRQPSSGYQIRITKLIETPETLRVIVEEILPGRDCNVLDTETSPCDLIVTKRVSKRVVFEIERQITDCKNKQTDAKD